MCALLREGGVDVFPVVIGKKKVVGLLKKAIKDEKPNDLKDVDADKLRLFLAKKGDAWLPSSTEDVKKLKKVEKTILIDALTEEDQELQAESGLEKVL